MGQDLANTWVGGIEYGDNEPLGIFRYEDIHGFRDKF